MLLWAQMAAVAETNRPDLSLEASKNGSITPTAITGMALMGGGVICRLSEGVQHPALPYVVQEAVNSGAHPILGFTAALAAKKLGVEKLSAAKQAAIYTALTLVADLGTEQAQDMVLTPATKFYQDPHVPENVKDLGFAFGGTLIGVILNRRRTAAKSRA